MTGLLSTSVLPRVIAFVGLSAVVVAAQPTQTIYLQYDGFVRNADSSLTLAFGYYNLNQVDVTIEVGDDNRFVQGGRRPCFWPGAIDSPV